MSHPQAIAARPLIPVRTDKEIRCPNCNHLLAKGELAPGSRVQFCCKSWCKGRTVTVAAM